MSMNTEYASSEPSREEVDALDGHVLIEFGAPWCGYCQGAQPLIASAMAAHPEVRHIKVEDGQGKRLGRSFRVRLWPTLVFMSRGREVARLVRPGAAGEIVQALGQLGAADVTGP